MSADTPAVRPALLLKIVMAKQFRIYVINFKARMVHVWLFQRVTRGLDKDGLAIDFVSIVSERIGVGRSSSLSSDWS